jgi:hypothetical protein
VFRDLIKEEGMYIIPYSFEEWIRKPMKNLHNVSIMWNVVVLAFPIIGDSLVWKVGNGNKVGVGKDPWIGCGIDYR